MKYFLKQYWRYIAMALAFATFNFLINGCEVKALERIQSIPLGYTATLPVGSNDSAIIYNSSSGNYANWGRGYLSFSLAEYWTSTGTSTNMTTIREINVTSSGNIYTCNFGSVAMDYDYEENVKVVSYSVICDVTMGANGLQQIKINHSNGLSNSIVVKTSDYMTFTDNLDIDISTAISTATSTMQTYLQTIINQQTNYTQSINTTITNVVNSNFSTIFSILNNGFDSINGRLDQILENNQVCETIDKNAIIRYSKYIDTNGIEQTTSNSNYGVTDYIKLNNKSKIKVLQNFDYQNACFYNANKEKISCIALNSLIVNSYINIPNNTEYFRSTIYSSSNKPQFEICKQGNQAVADNQKETNDTLKDSNTDGGQTQANDFFNNFDSGQTGTLMDLVSLPLEFLDSLNNTCSPITLTLPFINQTFELPCLRASLTSAFGGIVSIIVLVINALICYRLIKGFIDIIHNLKDPNNDEIEVMDL